MPMIGRDKTIRLLAIAVAALIPLAAAPQPPVESGSRPTVGVALEGGGALGLAHIGVLQWLEEHRVPVDYVAGTSMGGLVGGMYAIGNSPAQINELVSKLNWDDLLRGQIPYQMLSYRRKQDRRAFQNDLEFGLRGGFSIPGGLNTGQGITFIFDRAALPYSNLKSFDDLPVPFRCVATDLNTGKSHVFKDGPLGEALRSTMSLPAIFTPVRKNASLYADGGLLDNLPVDVVKQMGAGLVIAVNLNSSSFNTGQKQSMLSVMGRSISVMIAANELRSMEMADLLISVDLTGFSSSDYAAADKIIARGYQAAERKSEMLSKLSVDEETWRLYIERRNSRKIQSEPTPELIQVTGVAGRLAQSVQTELKADTGKPVDSDQLEHDLNLLSGTGRFSSFSYNSAEIDGKQALMIHANERDDAPPFLNLGVFINGADYNDVQFSISGRITALDLGEFRSEWRTGFTLGSIWALTSEYYRPITATSRWFVAPHVFATNNPLDLYDYSNRIAEYRISQDGGGFDVGYAISRSSELRVGYNIGYFQSSLSVGHPDLPTPTGRMGSSSIRYDLDKLDNPVVPRKGQAIRLRAQWYDTVPGAAYAFPLSEAYFASVHPISKPASVYVQAYGGTTFGRQATGLPQFFLGGPGRLAAYGTNELRTNQYFLARLGYLHGLFSLPPLLGNKVYFTSAYELGKAYAAPGGSSRLPNDIAVAVVAETFLGPLGIGGSIGDTGHHKWYFQLGRFF